MLNVTPTLTATGATSQTIKTVWTLASTDTPVVSTGYSTFTIEIRWDPTVATVLASSVKLIGNSAAGDVVIGRAMRAKDWGALRKAAQPLMDELEGEGLPDPKSGAGADSEGAPVPEQQAG